MSAPAAIYVISMASASVRRASMAPQLSRQATPWEFFDAMDRLPDGISYSAAEARRVHGRELTKGELGCFGSHVELWRVLVGTPGLETMCILEDDLVIDPGFFSRLAGLDPLLGRLGYLRLYAKVPVRHSYVTQLPDRRHVVRFHGKVFGTQGYVINRATAKRLLASIKRVVRPIDDELDRYWAHRMPAYCVFPFPVIEADFGSSIEGARRAKPQTGPYRMVMRAVERGRRLSSNVRLDLSARRVSVESAAALKTNAR